jgi:epoxyqueuosine reductase
MRSANVNPSQLSQAIKLAAADSGFDGCGICPAVAPPGLDRFHKWLERGWHGEMQYLETRRDACASPDGVMAGARSLVMLALSYARGPLREPLPGEGRVARYACGTLDYHDIIHERLKRLREAVNAIAPGAKTRGVVDTAPLLEREFAVLAGLGWQAKNTLVINRRAGSLFFLAALLTDLELEYDLAYETNHCGTCRACLEACPTEAFVEPGVLDATRCISYLTIELRSPVPVGLREDMQDRVFGCDICQEVCPWNRMAPDTGVASLKPADELNPLNLVELLDLDEAAFRARFRRTPLWRARRRGLLRNAAIVLGNQRATHAVPGLVKALADAEPLVRGAAAWALGKIGAAENELRARLAVETDPQVKQEIEWVLGPKHEPVDT